MAWVRARIEVPQADVERETAFWAGVAGGPLPAYLSVRRGDPGIKVPRVMVLVDHDSPAPAVAAPASFPGVRRTRVYQVCLDLPGSRFDDEAQVWADRVEGRLEVLGRRPEFAWVRTPDGPQPLTLLVQRLDRADGALSAHLDVGTSDRDAEVRRHVALGADVTTDEEFWTVLSDPAGLAYCITDRDPATGELSG